MSSVNLSEKNTRLKVYRDHVFHEMHDPLCDSNPFHARKQRSEPSGKFSTSLGLVSTKFGSAIMRRGW